MRRRTSSRAQLVANLFHDDWDYGVAAKYARIAAARARRARRIRRSVGATGVVLLLGSVALIFLKPPSDVPEVISRTAVDTQPRGYEILSTDELLTQLHDRPLLVFEEAGEAQAVLLDQPAS
ncbi:hypothetical protein BH18VER1_BH18VER1_21800 [soil metagenome]